MDTGVLLLVADPNPYVRSFLERELGSAGYRVKAAGSVKEIFACLRQTHPDLLIMDLAMPVRIGLKVLSRLQSLVPPTPVVIYTHHMEYEDHDQVRWVNAFVEKSGDPAHLETVIAGVLNEKKIP